MRKILLMLLLCAPLGWIAWREGQRLYEVSKWSSEHFQADDPQEGGKAADLEKSKANLRKIKEEADKIVAMPERAAATIVRLDPPPPGGIGKEPWEKAVEEHVKKREDGARKVEQARRDAAPVEDRIKETLGRMRGNNRPQREQDQDLELLRTSLADYKENKRVHDPDLIAGAMAESEWAGLDTEESRRKLDELYKNLNEWSPNAAGSKLVIDDKIKEAYRKYVRDHRTSKEPAVAGRVQEARARLALWEGGAELVDLLQDSGKDRVEQIERIAKLVEEYPSAGFGATTRRLVQALCGAHLKPEPLDAVVLVNRDDQAEPEPVQRAEVQIVPVNGEPFALGPPGPDEYTMIPRDQIKNLQLTNAIRQLPEDLKVPPLKGTRYSDAINKFNTQRNRIEHWSEAKLAELRKTCQMDKEDLREKASGRTLIDRLDRLAATMRNHPNLFVATNP